MPNPATDIARGQPGQALPGNRFLQGRFGDFDQLRETISRWDLDWLQLDKGPMTADVLQIETDPAVLTHVQFTRRFEQRGSTPPGSRTFGILDEGIAGVSWCGQNVTDANILCFPASGDYDAVSQPGFAGNTLFFPEDHLAAVAETLGIPDSVYLERQGAFKGDGEAVGALPRQLHEVYREAVRRSSALDSPGFQHQLEYEIPSLLLRALASSRGMAHRRPPSRVRSAGLSKALTFIKENAHEAVTVREVCGAAQVSWRTLDYAFREHFGVTPKQYLKAIRLSAVRRELHSAGPTAKISDVANRWGFWHMGQFAADYRSHFGELPSERFRGDDTAAGSALDLG